MTEPNKRDATIERFDKAGFNVSSLDDEIRADRLLQDLVRQFFESRMTEDSEAAEEAGRNARGADYFLREFIIGDRRENLFDIAPERIRQFAGNWYIVRNLEPNLAELGDILEGVAAFFDYLQSRQQVSGERNDAIRSACNDLDYYRQRIEDFWGIEGDGYQAWAAECPLPVN